MSKFPLRASNEYENGVINNLPRFSRHPQPPKNRIETLKQLVQEKTDKCAPS